MNPLQPLQDLIDQDQQPLRREFWLFLDALPNKTNALLINSTNLPTDMDCRSVARLDLILAYDGQQTKYGVLRRLCGSILACRPRRFLIFDLHFKKFAYLKIGGEVC